MKELNYKIFLLFSFVSLSVQTKYIYVYQRVKIFLIPQMSSATNGWCSKFGQLNRFLGSFVSRPWMKLCTLKNSTNQLFYTLMKWEKNISKLKTIKLGDISFGHLTLSFKKITVNNHNITGVNAILGNIPYKWDWPTERCCWYKMVVYQKIIHKECNPKTFRNEKVFQN